LFLAPWIERWITGDRDEHHLLDRPRDAPGRTATGAAGLALVTILFVGGGQDVVARMLDTPVGHVTTALQLLALVAPPVTWIATWHVCRVLRRRTGPERTERAVLIVRDRSGGYHVASEPALPAEAAAVESELETEVEA
jgi:ubiquinol-cytochrome c reductase cytochrome b subunit